ncbi:hypothetical protein WN943_023302 [Citrus x changshan-huyou]
MIWSSVLPPQSSAHQIPLLAHGAASHNYHLANGLHRAEAGSLKLEARRRTYCQQKMEQVLYLPPKRGCIKRRIFSSVYHELKVILHELGFHLLCSCFGNSSSG